jgi:hypothetical protein
VTLGASVEDVLSLAGQQLNAEGPEEDVLLFWDASTGKLTHLSLAPGLSITGTVLSVTAAGTGTVTSVNITPPAAGITVSGGPITSSGSITLTLADDLAAVEGLSTTGIVRRTGANTWSAGTQVNLASEVTGQLPYGSLSGTPDLSLKADLVGGVIPTSQLPSLAITEFLGTAANQPAMLALSGQRGDWCIRTDGEPNGGTWVLVVDGGSSLSHWQRLGYPIAPVSSVNGQTGDINLGFGDVGAAPANEGVANGNNHNHDGGDGAQIAYNSLAGLPTIPTPGGDTGQTQYRTTAGAFAGASGLLIDPTSGRLTLASFLAGTAPAAPTTGFTLYANPSNALSWIGANGFVRTFDGTANNADRAYTLQNKSGTIAHLDDITAANAGAQPLTFASAAISYAATVDLDMAVLTGLFRTISLTGNLTLTTSNRAAGRTVTLRLVCDGTLRNLTVPAGWVFLGPTGSKPSSIAASKTGVLSLSFFGTADTDCIAAWGVQA